MDSFPDIPDRSDHVPDGTADFIPGRLPLADHDLQAFIQAERLRAHLRQIGGGARIAAATPAQMANIWWLQDADGLAIAISHIDGQALALHPQRVDAIADALDAVAPLLDAIERQMGWAIEPTRAVQADALSPGNIALHLVANDPAATLLLSVPPAMAAHLPAIMDSDAMAPMDGPAVLIPVQTTIHACALSVGDVDELSVGDMVVLHAAPWRAELTTAIFDPIDGFYDPQSGQWSAQASMVSGVSSASEEDVMGLRDFKVPVGVRLPDRTATLAELDRLAAGSSFALGALSDGLVVELTVGGRAIAQGEIARIGDHFAVVVDRLLVDAATETATDQAGNHPDSNDAGES